MKRLKLPLNAEKTRCMRVPEESFDFPGDRVGRNHRRDTGRACIGTRPTSASVQSLCRRVSEWTARRYGLLDPEVVGRLNRLMTGWESYFHCTAETLRKWVRQSDSRFPPAFAGVTGNDVRPRGPCGTAQR